MLSLYHHYIRMGSTLQVAMIVGLLVSTTAGPSSGLEKNIGVGVGFGSVTVVRRPAVNRGTNYSRRANGSTI